MHQDSLAQLIHPLAHTGRCRHLASTRVWHGGGLWPPSQPWLDTVFQQAALWPSSPPASSCQHSISITPASVFTGRLGTEEVVCRAAALTAQPELQTQQNSNLPKNLNKLPCAQSWTHAAGKDPDPLLMLVT